MRWSRRGWLTATAAALPAAACASPRSRPAAASPVEGVVDWSLARSRAWLEQLDGGPQRPGEPGWESYWAHVREAFAFGDRRYLNNGSLGPSPAPVRAALLDAHARIDADPEPVLWGELGARMEAVRERLARMWNAAAEDFVLVRNTTEGCNLVGAGLRLQRGDQIVLTDREHGGGENGFLFLAERDGAEIVRAALPEGPDTGPDAMFQAVARVVGPRTRVFALPHIPYSNGMRLPVARLGALARENGIYFHVDGAHPPGMLPVDVQAFGCDSYASSAHKWYLGPKGTGLLWLSASARARLRHPFLRHGTAPYNPGSGTRGLHQWIALDAALEMHERIGAQRVWRRVVENRAVLRQGLGALAGFRPVSSDHPDVVSGLVTFEIEGPRNREVAARAHELGVTVKTVGGFGMNALRLTGHVYHAPDEIADAVGRLARAAIGP
ncbi:MAG TPA: aminotransferase class V-fold PLP-dependent enzyme [Planctomycetota bacterium]